MRNKLFALLALCAIALNAAAAALAADANSEKAKNQTSQLVALLPGSDAVVTLDAKRFFGEALPQLLTNNQPMLAKITGHIDEVKAKTGIDLRQFEQVVVGVTARKTAGKGYDFEPIVLARGTINAPALLAAAKLASNGKYREEKAGGKTLYVFDAQQLAAPNKPAAAPDDKPAAAEKKVGRMTDGLAVSALDGNTLAVGTAPRVRETLEAKTRVGSDLTALLYRKQTSVANFAAKLPDGMSQFVPLENDELGKNVDAIRYLYGAMDLAADSATLQMVAKTAAAEQAQGLLETLEGLRLVGKAFLGGAKGADKQVYARMIENAKFTRSANEVTLDLQVPQGDIDVLVGMLK